MKSPNRLRVLRAERRINQLDTAAKAKIVMGRYWKIENGYTEPTEDERVRLARALRTSIEELFPSSDVVVP